MHRVYTSGEEWEEDPMSQAYTLGQRAAAAPRKPAAHAELPPGIEPFPLAFSGRGGEFFRVWVVNVLLTVVTLGLYTPFARRRTAQYFYGHTLVADSPLEFTAPQGKMVMGFLMLAAVYIAFQIAAETGQDLTVALFLLAGAVLAPWLWGSAMRFRLAATRWRGVRLQFAAPWGEVYRASWPVFAMAGIGAVMGAAFPLLREQPALLVGLGLIALVGVLLCVIRLEFNYRRLLVLRARIGQQQGRWKPVYRDFVNIWLATVGVLLAGAAAVGLLVAVLAGGSLITLSQARTASDMGAMIGLIAMAVIGGLLGLLLASAPARAYREARLFQLTWNNVGVSHIARFRCDLRVWRYVGLRVLNLLLVLLTLGLYRPFAMVSEYRMKAESVTLHVKGGLDQLIGQLVAQQGGLGDAVADAVGLDLVG